MHADLMGAPGLERHAQQSVTRQELLDFEVRHGVARRLRVERLAEGVVAIAPDRGLDRAAPRARPSDDKRQILPRELACLHELLQPPVRIWRPGDDEQAGCVAVEPVHDARPLGLVSPFDVVREQSVHECPSRMSRRGMYHEPGRLVDHEQVLVLIRNDQIHLLRLERARPRGRRLEFELFPAFELVALRTRAPVDEHAPTAHETLRLGTRTDLGQLREEAVEALPCGLRRDV